MSDLHDLCGFGRRPIGLEYVEELKNFLKSGIPATYTVEEAHNYTNSIDEEPTSTTTPLHLICENIPKEIDQEELDVVVRMVEILLEYGAGWCHTDKKEDTPGCILVKRGMRHIPIYDQIVDAGVRAELLLRKCSEYDYEVIEGPDGFEEAALDETAGLRDPKDGEGLGEIQKDEQTEEQQKDIEEPENEAEENRDEKRAKEVERIRKEFEEDPSNAQSAYLKAKLEYSDSALLTKDRRDGVMMAWETDIMRLGCESLFKGAYDDGIKDEDVNILNIGFGMGIIDSMINEKRPKRHYICEAHPDVLRKMRDDGWYDKDNVIVLEGRWQEQVSKLLSQGDVFFNGIYYDTYSEHYEDMLELFDLVVGLLKPHGVFSFFNGLGADRQVVYDVYKKLVEIDLGTYGLSCSFTPKSVPETTLKEDGKSVWDTVKKSYWNCSDYYHPEVKFIDI